jgi:hypothetical protein
MADELLAGIGSETAVLGAQELREAIKLTLDKLGPKERVLIVPPVRRVALHFAHTAGEHDVPCSSDAALRPCCSRCLAARLQDFTRAHSQAGIITKLVYEYYGDKVKDILPALGSHVRSLPRSCLPRSCLPRISR